jgi:hypothetical protein
MTYKRLRDLHLILGLFSAVSLLGYALSSALMIFPVRTPWSTKTERRIEVPQGIDTAPRPLARWLMNEHGLRGELTDVGVTESTVALTIARMGTFARVEFDGRTRTASVTTRVWNGVGMLHHLHETSGLWHDYGPANAWGLSLLALSVSLLVLAVTGVVMWFARHRERRIGAVFLGVGLTWGLALLILIRYP